MVFLTVQRTVIFVEKATKITFEGAAHRDIKLQRVHIFSRKKVLPTCKFQKLKISSILPTSYFFSPKKVGKKGFGWRKMRCFCFLAPAAPKKTRRTMEWDFVLEVPFGSNTFWLHPPPLKQNLHFSKAGFATLGILYIISNLKIYYQKQKCTVVNFFI